MATGQLFLTIVYPLLPFTGYVSAVSDIFDYSRRTKVLSLPIESSKIRATHCGSKCVVSLQNFAYVSVKENQSYDFRFPLKIQTSSLVKRKKKAKNTKGKPSQYLQYDVDVRTAFHG